MRRPGVAESVAAAVLLAALFAGDALWSGLLVLIAAGIWASFALAGRAPLPAGGGPLLAALGALMLWTGLSIGWSVAPDRSWAELDRLLVYAGFLVLGLLFGARRAARPAALVLLGALAAAVLWALAGKAVPALFEDGGRAARLRDPIGYWNALALAADVLLVLALAAAAESRRRTARALAAALACAAVVAVALAASRAGVVAAVLGIGLLLLLRRDRVETALLALAAVVPGALVAGFAFLRPALVEDGAARVDRVADGGLFAVVLLLGLGAAGALASALSSLLPARRRTLGRALAAGAVVAAAALVAVAALNAGRIADEFGGGEVANDPGRFTSLSSNNRSAWWGEAWAIFRADPLTGAGANTFEVARKRHRETASAVTQPHSVPLQFLAGTGLVGLALLAGLVVAAALAGVAALRRLRGSERAAAAALAVALALWLAHALVDYPWDFAAVTGPALFTTGVLAAAGRELRPARSPLLAAGALALALAAAATVATPWLAARSVERAGEELSAGNPDAALAAAERARSLDPLSLEPVLALARVAERTGDDPAALAAYRDAARLQPENPESWLQLGLYEFDQGDRCAAYVHLNRAYTLDPAGRQWQPGGPLDEARDWVNTPGNC